MKPEITNVSINGIKTEITYLKYPNEIIIIKTSPKTWLDKKTKEEIKKQIK